MFRNNPYTSGAVHTIAHAHSTIVGVANIAGSLAVAVSSSLNYDRLILHFIYPLVFGTASVLVAFSVSKVGSPAPSPDMRICIIRTSTHNEIALLRICVPAKSELAC